eukprot:scaffold190657_cov24-Attheya_sp.AAC.1
MIVAADVAVASVAASPIQPWDSCVLGSCLVSSGRHEWRQTRSNRLFVQDCYAPLLQECKLLQGPPRQDYGQCQGVIVEGTPGVGKSCFLDYALHDYTQDEKKVLYLDGPANEAILYERNVAPQTYNLENALKNRIAEYADIIIFDPHEESNKHGLVNVKAFCKKPFIVAISPDRENCKKLRKPQDVGLMTLYMGPPSEAELEEMRQQCFPQISSAQFKNRYAKMGGIPRFLFARAMPLDKDKTLQAYVKTQSSALNLLLQAPLVIDAGEVAEQYKSLWSVYYLKPTSDYTDYTIELCCEDMRTRLMKSLMSKDVHTLWNIFVATQEGYGTLRGIRYEAYAHKKILTQGLEGTASNLTTGGVGRKYIQVLIPADLDEIALPTNNTGIPFRNATMSTKKAAKYLLPALSDFPVVDSVVVLPKTTFLLQMEAGRSKDLSGESASAIYDTTKGPLIFVVPDKSVIGKKKGFTGATEGPKQMLQFRIVLKGP